MNTNLIEPSNELVRPQAEESCGIVVFYENAPARERAARICDRLIAGFWTEIDFRLSWWKFDYLQDPEIARAAARAAAVADLVFVASQAQEELGAEVKAWLETWASEREDREGVLIGLIGLATTESETGLSLVHAYLRDLARRARMDFLPPARADAGIQHSIENIQRRANEMSSVLDGILHSPRPPSHWGINE